MCYKEINLSVSKTSWYAGNFIVQELTDKQDSGRNS